MSNSDTHHTSEISKHEEKSKKGEGVAETAKLKGTVSTDRPGVRIPRNMLKWSLIFTRPRTRKSVEMPPSIRTRSRASPRYSPYVTSSPDALNSYLVHAVYPPCTAICIFSFFGVEPSANTIIRAISLPSYDFSCWNDDSATRATKLRWWYQYARLSGLMDDTFKLHTWLSDAPVPRLDLSCQPASQPASSDENQ